MSENTSFENNYDKEKFSYGLDVNIYIDKAIEKLREQYHWADISMFSKYYRYAIEEENGEYHFIRYVIFEPDDIKREVWDVNPPSSIYKPVVSADDFVNLIFVDNEHHILASNKTVDTFEVPFEAGHPCGVGWLLEHYTFKKLQSGDFKVFVQAGLGREGASRDFFIPPHFLKGSFDEYLDNHVELINPDDFGLTKDELKNTAGLKEFLGFSE